MSPTPLSRIRNFSIIAHIDHGKSTLADRLLELTGTVQPGKMRAQYLDQLELERERGITIKMAPVVMLHSIGGVEYRLQCIDTPGHVDFGYEVSRALYACEGAVLLVDATQGVQAQTLAHGLLAKKLGLKIIAAINKIDLKEAQVDETALQIEALLDFPAEDILQVSAKTGAGVPDLLTAIVEKIPPPEPSPQQALRGLIFDSRYDPYKGVLLSVRVFSGRLEPRQEILLFHAQQTYEVEEVGIFRPHAVPAKQLAEGEVGYVAAQIKDPRRVRVGDTLMLADQKTTPLPGYEPVKPMVFCGLYPSDGESFEQLESALERLHLEDSSFEYQKETSAALGVGYRAGFLGFLHMDIVQQRLEREYDVGLVITSASVPYEVVLKSQKKILVRRPEEMPEMGEVAVIREPLVEATIITPSDYVGAVIRLCESARGELTDMAYPTKDRCIFRYRLPFSELVGDFYDRLKSVTSGYASFDYTFIGYAENDLVRLDVLVGGERVEALSLIVHRDKAYRTGRALVEKLRDEIPRHLFEIPIQAAIGSKVIARETIKPIRKNVLAKCYGGDVTRKRKLLEKQKEGKKRLKRVGRVDIPQDAFLSVFKLRQG